MVVCIQSKKTLVGHIWSRTANFLPSTGNEQGSKVSFMVKLVLHGFSVNFKVFPPNIFLGGAERQSTKDEIVRPV